MKERHGLIRDIRFKPKYISLAGSIPSLSRYLLLITCIQPYNSSFIFHYIKVNEKPIIEPKKIAT